MSEEKYNIYTSYKTLFRVRPVLYRFGDVPLPIPIRLESLVVFAGSFIILYPICELVEPITRAVLHVNSLITNAVFSGIIAYYAQNVDPAGKFLPVFIYDILLHFIKNKRVWLGGSMESTKSKINDNFVISVFCDDDDKGRVSKGIRFKN